MSTTLSMWAGTLVPRYFSENSAKSDKLDRASSARSCVLNRALSIKAEKPSASRRWVSYQDLDLPTTFNASAIVRPWRTKRISSFLASSGDNCLSNVPPVPVGVHRGLDRSIPTIAYKYLTAGLMPALEGSVELRLTLI